jgi:hypothetical protein
MRLMQGFILGPAEAEQPLRAMAAVCLLATSAPMPTQLRAAWLVLTQMPTALEPSPGASACGRPSAPSTPAACGRPFPLT